MVYLFKCLKIFLIRSLFSKHILLVTAKGEQYFGLIFFLNAEKSFSKGQKANRFSLHCLLCTAL